MEWKELAVTVSAPAAEAVAELFYTAGCSGVAVDDPNLLREYIEHGDWDYCDLIPASSDLVVVKGYYAADEFLSERLCRLKAGLEQLQEIFPGAVVQLNTAQVHEEQWATAWKKYFKPAKVGQRIVIKPSWEEYSGTADELIIELDPGMAFGTGTHPTTALCIRALERIAAPGMVVYDIGTGSGVLAIAAALLGAEVQAVDLDPVAVKVARENVAKNRLEAKVKVYHGNLANALSGSADLIVANIIADVIIVLADELERILRPGGVCIASGIIEERRREVEEALTAKGLSVQQVDEEGGWVLIQAGRKAYAPVSD